MTAPLSAYSEAYRARTAEVKKTDLELDAESSCQDMDAVYEFLGSKLTAIATRMAKHGREVHDAQIPEANDERTNFAASYDFFMSQWPSASSVPAPTVEVVE